MDTSVYRGLPKDWVYSSALDLELKQYTLLAYLQRVEERFEQLKLYPYLEDVGSQIDDLMTLRSGKTAFSRTINGELLGFDPSTGKALRAAPPEPALMAVIDDVIEFAIPGLQAVRDHGIELDRSFNDRVHIEAVGVQPIHASEGWLILRLGDSARVYNYSIPLVQPVPKIGTSIRTHFVTTYTLSLSHGYEQMKADLTKRYHQLPNPATFAVESELRLPCVETLLPLAKRSVLKLIASSH